MKKSSRKPKKDANSTPSRGPINFIFIVLGVFTIMSLFYRPDAANEIAYSDFKSKIKDNTFSKVYLGQTRVVGELLDQGQSQASQMTEVNGNESGNNFNKLFKAPKKTLSAVRLGEDAELIKILDASGVAYEYRVENNGLRDFFLAWVLPFAFMFFVLSFLFRKMGGGAGGEFMKFGRNQNRIKPESDLTTTFKDVAGQDEAKAELEEVVDFLKTPENFTHLGGKLPKGMLLVGPPGTGKTLLARAVAGEAKVPFFSISGSDFVEMFVGVGASRVRDLFKQARDKAPCIIFIDELDAVGKARGAGGMGGHDEREQTLNQLLVEMDGFDSRLGVILIAATNRPETLDPALLRAGRFDRQVFVGKPDLQERIEILKLHARSVKVSKDVNIETIAKGTPGMAGADLANVINEAALLAARRKAKSVAQQDFNEAVERTLAGLEKKKRVINPKEKKIVAHHEAGHAIVAALRGADRVHKISIVPRGMAALGYTMQVPTEDRYLMSKKELLSKIDVLLGGQAAEDVIFGEISTGASDDLQRATNIARGMVTQYGMGSTLGPATIERDRTPMMMDQGGVVAGKNFSEETAKLIDQEIKEMLKERMRQVKNLLKENFDLLTDVAETLLDKEYLNDKEFEEIVKKHQTKAA